jgi:antirestriction protein ArdC
VGEARRDLYQDVTDRMIAALEAGTAPWRRPWSVDGCGGLPVSGQTGRPYRGVNAFILPMIAAANGWGSDRWFTFNGARSRGGHVRKGEKGSPVVFFKRLVVADKRATADADATVAVPLLRWFVVFNLEQCEGGELDELKRAARVVRPEPERLADCEALAARYLADGGPALSWAGGAAFYRPATDAVVMPDRDRFSEPAEVYSTLFHELTHSTGHKSRLARKGVDGDTVAPFGSEDYSQEELVAEMGAAMLCAQTGIGTATLGNSAAYVAGWLKRLREDRRLVVVAAAQAQRAVDRITGATFGAEGESES